MLGTLQIVDPSNERDDKVYAYRKWPENFPKDQPEWCDAVLLARGELVLVVETNEKNCGVWVISSQGLVHMSIIDFYLPGFMACQPVDWVVEQHDVVWYFGT